MIHEVTKMCNCGGVLSGAVLKLLEFEEILILERPSMIPCEVNKYGPSLTKMYCLYEPRCIMRSPL